MPHPLTELKVRTVRKPAGASAHQVSADVCVVGAGIAGLSAAVESARLGRDVVLVDALPVLGGQMVNSLIGLFCGVFGNAPDYHQLTHGIFDDIFRDLGATGDLFHQRRHTLTVGYDEVVLGRWVEDTVREHGIRVITGAAITGVVRSGERVESVTFATRYGSSWSTSPRTPPPSRTSWPSASARKPNSTACAVVTGSPSTSPAGAPRCST
jgi:NADPH-dependent 2,4-dienoyl-CoA reductase/sulfur reductase-like enzyme